jgi:hypothetical protein
LQEEIEIKKALKNRQIQGALKVKYHEGTARRAATAVAAARRLNLSIDHSGAMEKADWSMASAGEKCKVRL